MVAVPSCSCQQNSTKIWAFLKLEEEIEFITSLIDQWSFGEVLTRLLRLMNN